MKIAFVLPSDLLSGGNLVVYEHAKALKQLGHDIGIIFSNWKSNPNAKDPAARRLTGNPIWFNSLGHDFPAIDWDSAKSQKFDLVIATWWETAYQIFELDSTHKAYFVQSDERKFYSPAETFNRAGVELSYNLPLIFITEAKWIQKLLKDDFAQESYLMPNGVCPKRYHPITPLQPKKQGVMRVLIEGAGSIEYKRVRLAFEAVKEVSGIEVWYVCGDGYKEDWWHADKFLGSVSPDKMKEVYSSCDVILKLSVVEGFFLPPLEMMACGGTAIVSNVSGHEEYIRHEQNALVVPMDDKLKTIEALIRLRDDPILLEKLKNGGKSTAEKMTWSHLPDCYKHLLSQLSTRPEYDQRTSCLLKLIPALKVGISAWQYHQTYTPQIEFVAKAVQHETRIKLIEDALTEIISNMGIRGKVRRFIKRLKNAA